MKKIAIFASCLLVSYNAWAKGGDKTRPNVIIILADDLGYGDMSCYGATRVQTPNVDRLASEGCRFTDVHACASTSTPSRYALLTGQYAWRRPDTNIARGDAGMIIKPSQYTIADMFRSRGYTTAAIGKWHLGLGETTGTQDWNAPLAMHLGDIGFDYHYIMAATADRTPCVFIEQGQVANYDPSAPIYTSYERNFEGEPTGKSNPELLTKLRPSHGHDMSIVNGISRIGFMKGGGKALWRDEDIADSIVGHAIKFMHNHKDEPFFMYLCTNDVHVPRYPHERFRGKSPMGLRGEAILQFDWTVGKVMDALKKMKLDDNTIVILSSDNGPVIDDGYQDQAVELLGDHKPSGPLRGYKYSAYEGGTTVPAIVRWKGHVAAGQTNDALMSQVDWFRSLGTLIGARIPQTAAPDSQDHLDGWLNRSADSRESVVEMSVSRNLTVRTKDWKYIAPNDGFQIVGGPNIETGNMPQVQLFHISKDRSEQYNVAAEYPEVIEHLSKVLKENK